MSREERRRARAMWRGHVTRLADEPDLDPDVLAMTPDERVAMVWRLTLDAWALGGREIPSYSRRDMPGRMVRSGP